MVGVIVSVILFTFIICVFLVISGNCCENNCKKR